MGLRSGLPDLLYLIILPNINVCRRFKGSERPLPTQIRLIDKFLAYVRDRTGALFHTA